MSVGVQLLRCAAPGGVACTVMADVGTPLIGTPGCGLFAAPSIVTPVVDNQNFRYVVVINITGANTTVSAGGVQDRLGAPGQPRARYTRGGHPTSVVRFTHSSKRSWRRASPGGAAAATTARTAR